MKKLIVLAVLSAFVLGACTKYEEGPKFTVKTNKMRLCKTWKIESVTDASGNAVVFDVNQRLVIDKDGSFVSETFLGDFAGTWSFSGDDQIIYVFDLLSITSTETIKKLYSKEFWVVNNNGVEYHYVPAD
ncbi:MAG: hypothetical protein ABIJ16_06560 [Bacteroidota bacterium]